MCRVRMSWIGGIVVLSTLAASACSSEVVTLDDPSIELGFVDHGTEIVFEVPDTVDAGSPFQVATVTYGSACRGKHETEVVYGDDRATILPWDSIPRTGNCILILHSIEHETSVEFDSPGEYQVTLEARRHPNATVQVDVPVVVR